MDRSIAPCSRPPTNVISPLHDGKKERPCTKALVTPVRHLRMNRARLEERKRRERETGKTENRRLMERKAAQQNKNLSEELKQGLPRESSV